MIFIKSTTHFKVMDLHFITYFNFSFVGFAIRKLITIIIKLLIKVIMAYFINLFNFISSVNLLMIIDLLKVINSLMVTYFNSLKVINSLKAFINFNFIIKPTTINLRLVNYSIT